MSTYYYEYSSYYSYLQKINSYNYYYSYYYNPPKKTVVVYKPNVYVAPTKKKKTCDYFSYLFGDC